MTVNNYALRSDMTDAVELVLAHSVRFDGQAITREMAGMVIDVVARDLRQDKIAQAMSTIRTVFSCVVFLGCEGVCVMLEWVFVLLRGFLLGS